MVSISLEEAIIQAVQIKPRSAESLATVIKAYLVTEETRMKYTDGEILSRIWLLVDRGWLTFDKNHNFALAERPPLTLDSYEYDYVMHTYGSWFTNFVLFVLEAYIKLIKLWRKRYL